MPLSGFIPIKHDFRKPCRKRSDRPGEFPRAIDGECNGPADSRPPGRASGGGHRGTYAGRPIYKPVKRGVVEPACAPELELRRWKIHPGISRFLASNCGRVYEAITAVRHVVTY